MGKAPSEAAQLRNVRSENRRLWKRVETAEAMLSLHRQRADKAEVETRQWQARFDSLLQLTRQPRNAVNGDGQHG